VDLDTIYYNTTGEGAHGGTGNVHTSKGVEVYFLNILTCHQASRFFMGKHKMNYLDTNNSNDYNETNI